MEGPGRPPACPHCGDSRVLWVPCASGIPGGCLEPWSPGFAVIWASPISQGDTGGKRGIFKPTQVFCSMPLTCPTQEPPVYPSLTHLLHGVFRAEEQNSSGNFRQTSISTERLTLFSLLMFSGTQRHPTKRRRPSRVHLSDGTVPSRTSLRLYCSGKRRDFFPVWDRRLPRQLHQPQPHPGAELTSPGAAPRSYFAEKKGVFF